VFNEGRAVSAAGERCLQHLSRDRRGGDAAEASADEHHGDSGPGALAWCERDEPGVGYTEIA
jgi:hypothetical protein